MASLVGTRLGQYAIESLLGAGGMGVVYRAFDQRLQRHVAIKVFPEVVGDANARGRLLHEARSASALNHPNVCTVYEVGESDAFTYLVMEYVEGQTLRALNRPGGLPVEQIAAHGAQIASALAHAHERGVVHRDLKSANVVVTPDGRAKVLDFGIALRRVSPTDDTQAFDSLQSPNSTVGTVPYMSPEAVRGAVVDFRTDIWALGVLLYEMASATLPFQGHTAFETCGQILHGVPAPLPARIPPALVAVVERCLAKEPQERYHSAAEVRMALETSPSRPFVASTVGTAALGRDDGRRAVLVLPFTESGGKAEGDYFSDGLTEEIIADLSNVGRLRVISRNSSMQLKGTDRSIAQLARDLKVEFVLDGSVRRSGNQLRITVALIDPATDSPLWGHKYQGTVDDVFAIQETIARSIVKALRIKLTADEERALAERPLSDVRAYEWYLRAKHELLRFTTDGLDRALEYLVNSSAIAGENVLLLAVEGEAYWQYVNAGLSADPAYLDKAEACARRILEINPESPHGHRIAGLVLIHRGDMQGALRQLKQALDLDPNDLDCLLWGSLLAGMSGKSAFAEKWADRLVDLDPVTPFYQTMPAAAAFMRGDADTALAFMAANQSTIRDHAGLRFAYGQILATTDNATEARAVLEALARDLPEHPFGQFANVYRHALAGDRIEMMANLTPSLVEVLRADPQYCWFLAQSHALVHDIDGGIRWIEAAVAGGFINHDLLARHDPMLANLRDDPRFVALLSEVAQRVEALEL